MNDNRDQESTLSTSLCCSVTRCNPDEDTKKLVCADCERSVHYRCTKLPAYQIQAYIVKKKRNYFCSTCIFVPADLEKLINPFSKEQIEINRLRCDIRRCENNNESQWRKFQKDPKTNQWSNRKIWWQAYWNIHRQEVPRDGRQYKENMQRKSTNT